MTISEAVSVSRKVGLPIAVREPSGDRRVLHLWPTDTAACVIMVIHIGERWSKLAVRWNPTAHDLVRDDWIVVPTEDLWQGELEAATSPDETDSAYAECRKPLWRRILSGRLRRGTEADRERRVRGWK